MRRVVITGAGIVSCIGHDLTRVTQSLKEDNLVSPSMSPMPSMDLSRK